ncbi:transposase (fragment) [Candidatus Nitrosocaldus cavascurensis]|uniref:Transposase n=1 Tax=Candidatus Nitrosocaldus cavascurensis TaxID=2058097 RepID=A0A2K5ARA3_9ARCH
MQYGYRWIAEPVLSSFKRLFGEHVIAKKYIHMVKGIIVQHIP